MSYPMWGFKAVTSINELLSNFEMFSLFALIPITQFSLNDWQASDSKEIECSTFQIINGLNTFSSKWPLEPPMEQATLFPITCAQTIVIASHYVGLTFPGIIDEPGSFSGRSNSPSPDLGPEARNLISFDIFIRATASVFNDPENYTRSSCPASPSNLFS